MNFTQYKTKEAFLRKYPIENGQLNLSNKGITDDDLKHIVELLGNELSVEVLSLYNNQLTEIHPDTFKGLSSLKWLNLYDNQFTQLHKSIREMLPDCSIYTNDNIKWVDDVEERQDVNNVTENCITKLKNQISKLNDYLNDITIYDFTKKYKIKAIIQCIILSILTTYLIILVFHFLITTIC